MCRRGYQILHPLVAAIAMILHRVTYTRDLRTANIKIDLVYFFCWVRNRRFFSRRSSTTNKTKEWNISRINLYACRVKMKEISNFLLLKFRVKKSEFMDRLMWIIRSFQFSKKKKKKPNHNKIRINSQTLPSRVYICMKWKIQNLTDLICVRLLAIEIWRGGTRIGFLQHVSFIDGAFARKFK